MSTQRSAGKNSDRPIGPLRFGAQQIQNQATALPADFKADRQQDIGHPGHRPGGAFMSLRASGPPLSYTIPSVLTPTSESVNSPLSTVHEHNPTKDKSESNSLQGALQQEHQLPAFAVAAPLCRGRVRERIFPTHHSLRCAQEREGHGCPHLRAAQGLPFLAAQLSSPLFWVGGYRSMEMMEESGIRARGSRHAV